MTECIRSMLLVLPWVLLIASATFLALGVSWRHLSDSDTINGTFLVISIVFAALTCMCLCVREIPARVEQKDKEKEPPPASTANMPLVAVA